MIEPRILEILKEPELISVEDLPLFEAEIQKYPYVQNIKAAYLFGVHRFQPDHYQAELSKTAAYTTDKKILYYLINKKATMDSLHKKVELSTPAVEVTKDICDVHTESCTLNDFYHKKLEAIKHTVYVGGERNRILFQGEENLFQETSTNTQSRIEEDLSTQSLMNEVVQVEDDVMALPIKEGNETEIEIAKVVEGAELVEENLKIDTNQPLEIKDEEETSKSQNLIEQQADVQQDEFSEVVVHSLSERMINEEDQETVPDPDEIFELKEDEDLPILAASTKVVEEQEVSDPEMVESEELTIELNFHNVDDFLPKVEMHRTSPTEEQYQPTKDQSYEKYKSEMDRLIAEVEAKMKLNKKTTKPVEEEVISNEINFYESHQDVVSTKELDADKTKNDDVERPALSVSFFSATEQIVPKAEEIEANDTTLPEQPKVTTAGELQSNVPIFINTWQNWLKIDRASEEKIPSISIEEIRAKAIDTFIENEPKISPLKAEVAFVMKERPNDISHLMTETLANLYLSQRLYTKAIHAFEVLKGKHPEKEDWYAQKIKEVKDQRSGN